MAKEFRLSRVFILTDELNPVSPTGESLRFKSKLEEAGVCVKLVHCSDSDFRTPDTFHIKAKRAGRFSLDALRVIRDQLRGFGASQLVCLGSRAIEAGPWVGAGLGIHLTAIHSELDSLCHGFLNWRQRVALSRFDLHITRRTEDAEQLRSRFPNWAIETYPWTRADQSVRSAAAEIKQQLNIPQHAKLVGTVSDLRPGCRVKDFVWGGDLMRCIRDDVYWLVMGTGTQEWRLKRFTRQLDVRENVQFLGLPIHAAQIVASLDVYVQPSTQDQNCVGLGFAAQHGIPLVGIIHPMHRPFIRHGVNGFLVERGARNEISRCVNRIVNEPEIAQRFSNQSRSLADALLTDCKDFDRLFDLRSRIAAA